MHRTATMHQKTFNHIDAEGRNRVTMNLSIQIQMNGSGGWLDEADQAAVDAKMKVLECIRKTIENYALSMDACLKRV